MLAEGLIDFSLRREPSKDEVRAQHQHPVRGEHDLDQTSARRCDGSAKNDLPARTKCRVKRSAGGQPRQDDPSARPRPPLAAHQHTPLIIESNDGRQGHITVKDHHLAPSPETAIIATADG